MNEGDLFKKSFNGWFLLTKSVNRKEGDGSVVTEMITKLIEFEDFIHYLQGIYSLKNSKKIGAEVLIRSKYGTPDTLFYEAKLANKVFELEVKSIFKLIRALSGSNRSGLLFINLYPSTIVHPKFPDFITKLSRRLNNDCKSIVFEIIEAEKVSNIALLKERIGMLKDSGFLIAIDDIGKGWSSLSMIIEIDPHYIKLDRYFAINLSSSILKQQMIKSLISYAENTNIQVILEGVETERDLATAKLLGVTNFQGFLLDVPKPLVI